MPPIDGPVVADTNHTAARPSDTYFVPDRHLKTGLIPSSGTVVYRYMHVPARYVAVAVPGLKLHGLAAHRARPVRYSAHIP